MPTRSSLRTWPRVLVVGLLLHPPSPEVAVAVDETSDKILEWSLPGLPEPSAVVYHASRVSLFVVSDDGTIGEVSVDGKVRATRALGGDLEGITYDPASGNLYVVREGHEIIFEVDPNSFVIRRRFTIDRSFEGDADFLERGGDGIEGLTFVPDSRHREGGRFFAVNQFDPPALVELALPLRSSRERFEKARVVAAHRIASPPLSDAASPRSPPSPSSRREALSPTSRRPAQLRTPTAAPSLPLEGAAPTDLAGPPPNRAAHGPGSATPRPVAGQSGAARLSLARQDVRFN